MSNELLLRAMMAGGQREDARKQRRAANISALANLAGQAVGAGVGAGAGAAREGGSPLMGAITGLGVGGGVGQTIGGLAAGPHGAPYALQGAQQIPGGFNPLMKRKAAEQALLKERAAADLKFARDAAIAGGKIHGEGQEQRGRQLARSEPSLLEFVSGERESGDAFMPAYEREQQAVDAASEDPSTSKGFYQELADISAERDKKSPELENQLSTQFRSESDIKSFDTVSEYRGRARKAISNIKKLQAQGREVGTQDLTILAAYGKSQDPNAVLRQDDIEVPQSLRSLGGSLAAVLARVREGAALNNEQRLQLMSSVDDAWRSLGGKASARADEMRQVIAGKNSEGFNLSETRIIPGKYENLSGELRKSRPYGVEKTPAQRGFGEGQASFADQTRAILTDPDATAQEKEAALELFQRSQELGL